MSKRVVGCAAVLACAFGTATSSAADGPPLMQAPDAGRAAAQPAESVPGPLEKAAKPITPENPIPRRTHSVTPRYPSGIDAGAVIVSLRVTLDAMGRVGEVRLSGGAALQARGANAGARDGGAATAPGPGGASQPPDAFVKAAIDATRQWIYEPPADGPIALDVTFAFVPGGEARLLAYGAASRSVTGGVPAGVVGGVVGGLAAPPPPPPPAGAVRVGGNIKPPMKVKHVTPVYPAIAQSAQIQGDVILEATIGADGKVKNVRVVRSIPLLDQAAIDAVRQWEFVPTLINGQAVPVIMTATVGFKLTQ